MGDGGHIVARNCTFSSNSANLSGGAIHVRASDDSAALFNCIFWGNMPDEVTGQNIEMTYSNVEGGYAGMGNIDADPLFVDPDNGDFRLLPGSPSIDAADNDALPVDTFDLDSDGDVDEPSPYDLDSNPRQVDDLDTEDTGNGVAPIVDMGAYEFGFVDCNGNGVLDSTDIAEGTSNDCNETGIPDECEMLGVLELLEGSDDLAPFGNGFPQSHEFTDLPEPIGDVLLSFMIRGDFDGLTELASIELNGTHIGDLLTDDGEECPEDPQARELLVALADFVELVPDGAALVDMIPSDAVNADCGGLESFISVEMTLRWPTIGGLRVGFDLRHF